MANPALALMAGCILALATATQATAQDSSNAQVEQSITRAQNDLRLQDEQRQLNRAAPEPAVQNEQNRLDQLNIQSEQQLQGPLLTGPNASVENSISHQQTQLQLQSEQNRIDQLRATQPLH